MNFSLFFARRITLKNQRSVSGLVVKLAIISISLAVATMEISLSFVQGFETEIQNKVIGFGSHIQIGNYLPMLDTEVMPLPKDEPMIAALKTASMVQTDSVIIPFLGSKWVLFTRSDTVHDFVQSVSPYVERVAYFKSESGQSGISFKGVDSTYDWNFFSSSLKDGVIPTYKEEQASRDILISRRQAKDLDLHVGDKAHVFFFRESVDQRPLRRPVTVAGIYETGMEEFDNAVMICDMRMLQRVWKWNDDEVSGFEVNLTSLSHLDAATDYVNEHTPPDFGAEPITYLYPEIFEWLSLQHQNVRFILILMMIVAVINMTSVVLILIIERTRTVGILKALGMASYRIQRMFVWNAFFLILVGVLIGNVLGIGLLASQDIFGWFKLSQESYFIEVVPVAWVWFRFLVANLGIIFICTLFMFIPTVIITRISPVSAIRFD